MKKNEVASKTILTIYSWFLWFGSRGPLLLGGIVWLNHQKVEKCYKKWLGPQWRYDKVQSHEGAGVYVANHQGFADIFIQLGVHNPTPGFIAKDAVRKVFLIGRISDKILNSLFVKRADKNNKMDIFNALQERQRRAELGEVPPISLYPEGATTNGTGLINFKKGAFASLHPVKPFCIKYWSLRGQLNHGDASHYHYWIFIAFNTILSTLTYSELPFFTPNEYFWQHHWDGKEEKWVAYARVVRKIIAEHGGFELIDADMEDKLEYKLQVRSRGKKSAAPKTKAE